MPSKQYWSELNATNPVMVTLQSSKTGKMRHVHCFQWDDNDDAIVTKTKRGTAIIEQRFDKPEWGFGGGTKNTLFKIRAEAREKMATHEAVAGAPVYVTPEDAPVIPVQKPAVFSEERLRDGRVLQRSPGDLTKEQPGEYNAWAHRNDPVDEEGLFKLKVSAETEFARQEAQRAYLTWKARREGSRAFQERPQGQGVAVGVAPPKR